MVWDDDDAASGQAQAAILLSHFSKLNTYFIELLMILDTSHHLLTGE